MLLATGPILGLSAEEVQVVRGMLGREPNDVEWAIIDAEWSEHSSYKSSRALLKRLPTSGKRVVLGPGYDAGVVDVGKGYVVTLHIESHNHPSAIDPYGGSATGIGGVLRDIIAVGSRPIALVDVLRFGDAEKSLHSRWLLRNVVRGIADYGNCVGIPTVAGEVEFDPSFERNCLVDVACVGVGKKGKVVLGEARNEGDVLVLIGGSTGRDGVGGAAFASRNLGSGPESDRRSVQVPDPFMKKLLLDALEEVVATGLLTGMKDLGGGGLSTALSEVALKGRSGLDVDLDQVRLREAGMAPREIMISESQERMLLVLRPTDTEDIFRILDKYDVPHSLIGRVTATGSLTIKWRGRIIADLPANAVADAPLIPRKASRPARMEELRGQTLGDGREDLSDSLLTLLSSPNIASKRWIYEQYDHEVGIRTVLKPGEADASLLRLPNGSMLAVKADGNSTHSYLNPKRGGAGCVAEASRNVAAVGAEPIAMVNHLQFGDPSDEEVYWTFEQTIEGMAQYCTTLPLPIVGGKVSFYNEDASSKRAIKPSPVALVVGLLPSPSEKRISQAFAAAGDESVFVIGTTAAELGGSEYCERVLKQQGGEVPLADANNDSRAYAAIRRLVGSGIVNSVHDCSRGGLSVAIAEMCFPASVGANIDVGPICAEGLTHSEALFSESHGRFVVSTNSTSKLSRILTAAGVPFTQVGKTGGNTLVFLNNGKKLARLKIDAAADAWRGGVSRLME